MPKFRSTKELLKYLQSTMGIESEICGGSVLHSRESVFKIYESPCYIIEISAATTNRLHGRIRRKNEAHSTKNKYRQIVIANGGAENTENNNC